MPVGIKCLNDWGTIQIDDVSPTLTLHESGVVQIGDSGESVVPRSSSFEMAVRASSVVGAFYATGVDPYNDGWRILGEPGTQVSWYLFGPPIASQGGMVIRNADGDVMFDAYSKSLRHAGMRTGNQREDWGGSVTYGSGRIYATMGIKDALDYQNTFRTIRKEGNMTYYEQREDMAVSGASVSGSRVTFGMTRTCRRIYGEYGTSGSVPNPFGWETHSATIAVIDVTDY